MSRLADIRSEKISGFARGAGYSLFNIDNLQNSNHAWNAVYIDEGWYLVDVTWDSGYLNGRSYKKNYGTSYLFLEPYKMLYTHYPNVSTWQLMKTEVSAENFQNLSSYRGNYFQVGLDALEDVAKKNLCDNSVELSIPTPKDISSNNTDLKFPVQYKNYQENGFFLYLSIENNFIVGEKKISK